MQVYLVGGAVRDEQLGLPLKERDWCVVGATPAEMKAAGYKQVGKDFPVFLHPDTGEEYALARTERKTAAGYHGFEFHTDPGVTIEDDLGRRDLTINAIAQDTDGNLVDPYGGIADIRNRILRHVSDAFVEDPVRVLRVARFAARFAVFRHGFRYPVQPLEQPRRPQTPHQRVQTGILQEFLRGVLGSISNLFPDALWLVRADAWTPDGPGQELCQGKRSISDHFCFQAESWAPSQQPVLRIGSEEFWCYFGRLAIG